MIRRYDPPLITALADGSRPADAARKAGVSGRTVRRRLADPSFRRRLSAARVRLLRLSLNRVADRLAAKINDGFTPTVEDVTAARRLTDILACLISMAASIDAPADPHHERTDATPCQR